MLGIAGGFPLVGTGGGTGDVGEGEDGSSTSSASLHDPV